MYVNLKMLLLLLLLLLLPILLIHIAPPAAHSKSNIKIFTRSPSPTASCRRWRALNVEYVQL